MDAATASLIRPVTITGVQESDQVPPEQQRADRGGAKRLVGFNVTLQIKALTCAHLPPGGSQVSRKEAGRYILTQEVIVAVCSVSAREGPVVVIERKAVAVVDIDRREKDSGIDHLDLQSARHGDESRRNSV
jgi:hypothetical protein